MNNSRTPVLEVFKFSGHPTISLLPLVLLAVLTAAATTKSQARFPGPAARENNRAMDEYDRTINRMKNDSKAVKERRLNLFPQINEDFQEIQKNHNEIVRMLQPDKGLNYDRLAEFSGDIKRRSSRLRENLALPDPEQPRTQQPDSELTEAQLKKSIAELHELVVNFVASPIFKNLGVVDYKNVDEASRNLDGIIQLSDDLKRQAKLLNKAAKK